jgi:hypothetical protein
MAASVWNVRLGMAVLALAFSAAHAAPPAPSPSTSPATPPATQPAQRLAPVATLDTSAAGPHTRMWIGDVNGDGRMDLVFAQADYGFNDAIAPHLVVAITAFDLSGTMLWQIGTPDPANRSGTGSDIPMQIADLDGDGDLEVIACMNDELRIYDGRTATLQRSHPLPDRNAHDCIVLADFAGRGVAGDIVLKDRYRRLWALDRDFNLLFTFRGNIGHYPWPVDLDGDGRDELIAGYHVLGPDGREKWRMDLAGHADAIWVADVDADPSNGLEIIVGGDGTYLYDRDGKQLWAYEGTVESQNAFAGDFRPDLPGLEIGGIDRINRSPGPAGRDGLFLIDANGRELYKEQRTVPGWSSIATVVHDFDGRGSDHFLAYRRGGNLEPVLYDGWMNRLYTLPMDGQFMSADLLGAGGTQVVGYDTHGRVEIYSLTPFDLSAPPSGKPLPQPKRLANWTRYWGSQTPSPPSR